MNMHTLQRRRDQLRGHKCCARLCAHFTIILISGVWCFYLILGSVVFVAIEQEESNLRRKRIDNEFKILLTEFITDVAYNTSINNDTIPVDALKELQSNLYNTLGLHPNDFIHWDFLGGVHYCLSVISTIGYGHYVPTSQLGRGLTMVYALFGIPLNLIFLARIGAHLSRLIAFTYYQLSCFVDRSRERQSGLTSESTVTTVSQQSYFSEDINDSSLPNKLDFESKPVGGIDHDYREQKLQNGQATQEIRRHNSNSDSEMSVNVTGCTSVPANFKVPLFYVGLLYLMYNTGGALLIWYREKPWTFLDSFYFAFISLSTIGFGDLLPNSFTSDDQMERIMGDMLLIAYISLGMALLSASFNILINRADGLENHENKSEDIELSKTKTSDASPC
ncbi:two pore potassium channel protein sup-9-like [Anneissia japonica]|uniref:two pore potassium channel protein sup-9-like n=1 Tax=Anneissia japonica TaxID=1529436 RepID=UPI0014257B0C|nr:two pore potassium channel protein sup-9-like [Anneissia japonica]